MKNFVLLTALFISLSKISDIYCIENSIRLENSHFTVFYPQNYELAAQSAVESAEDALADCCDLTSSRPFSRFLLKIVPLQKQPVIFDRDGFIYISYNGIRTDLTDDVYRAVCIQFMDRYFTGHSPGMRNSIRYSLSQQTAYYLLSNSVKYGHGYHDTADWLTVRGAAVLNEINIRYGHSMLTEYLYLRKKGFGENAALKKTVTSDSGELQRRAERKIYNGNFSNTKVFNKTYETSAGIVTIEAGHGAGATRLKINGKSISAASTMERDFSRSVSVSPDGNVIFAWYNTNGSGITVFDSTGRVRNTYRFCFLSITYPVLLEDRIVFCAGKNSGTDIISYSKADSKISLLTDTIESESHLFFDYREGRLMFCTGDAGSYRLCVYKDGKFYISGIIPVPGEISSVNGIIRVGEFTVHPEAATGENTEVKSDKNGTGDHTGYAVDYSRIRSYTETVPYSIYSLKTEGKYHGSTGSARVSSDFVIAEYAEITANGGLFTRNMSVRPSGRFEIRQTAHSYLYGKLSNESPSDPLYENHFFFGQTGKDPRHTSITAGFMWYPFSDSSVFISPEIGYISAGNNDEAVPVAAGFGYNNSADGFFIFRGFSVKCVPVYISGKTGGDSAAVYSQLRSGFHLAGNFFIESGGGGGTVTSNKSDTGGLSLMLPGSFFSGHLYGDRYVWGSCDIRYLQLYGLPFGLKSALRTGGSAGSAWTDSDNLIEDNSHSNFSTAFFSGIMILKGAVFLTLDAIYPYRYRHIGYPDINFKINAEL